MEPWRLAVALVGFAIVVIFLIRPVTIKFSCLQRSRLRVFRILSKITLSYATVPALVALIFLATTVISPADAGVALAGTDTLKPYAIVILFFSLAYSSISLDCTGLFNWIAIKAVLATRGRGMLLFLVFFALSSVITIVTSNDIVILTITPIITALANLAGVNPIPLLFSQFFAANIWSMFLFIGNPTNIIVAQAEQIGFLEYSKWMVVPTVICGLSCFLLLYATFRSVLPGAVELPQLNPRQHFNDPIGAIFASVLLGMCIACLIASNWISVPIWAITLTFAVIQLIKDIIMDIREWRKRKAASREDTEQTSTTTDSSDVAVSMQLSPSKAKDNEYLPNGNTNNETSPTPYRTITVIKRLPWKIVPFVLGIFIIVHALSVVGFTKLIAEGLAYLITSHDTHTAKVFMGAIYIGMLSALVCQILNNQPMTILFTRILQEPVFTSQVMGSPRTASMFALIMGSNLGGNLTLVGALAGIMWISILSTKGVTITPKQFMRYGFLINLPVLFLGLITIATEFAIFGQSEESSVVS